MAIDDVLLDAEEKMLKSEEHVQHEFSGVRTGKASPALVENIQAEVYGSMMRIRELANISVPESRMLMIQPWDAGSIGPIEKAITYMVRPRMQPSKRRFSFWRISMGSSQLLVGPASSFCPLQMKVRSSMRATSLGCERAR